MPAEGELGTGRETLASCGKGCHLLDGGLSGGGSEVGCAVGCHGQPPSSRVAGTLPGLGWFRSSREAVSVASGIDPARVRTSNQAPVPGSGTHSPHSPSDPRRKVKLLSFLTVTGNGRDLLRSTWCGGLYVGFRVRGCFRIVDLFCDLPIPA